MNKDNIENIDRLRKFVLKYTELIAQVIDKFEKFDRKKDLLGYCNYIFLLRFYYNSNAIRLLLPKLKKDHYFKIPIGIITRTCISDVLTFYYFYYIAKKNENESEFNKLLKTFLAESLHYFKRHLENEINEDRISQKEYEFLIEEFTTHYKDFHDPSLKQLIPENHISFNKIRNLLKSSKEFNWVSPAYDYYDYLSKYDHFGAVTFDIQELHKSKPMYDIQGYIICLGYVYEAVISILKIYKIDECYEKRIKYIRNVLFT